MTSTPTIAHRTVEANGLRFHIADAGEGPLVLLCHGFPELWYSWRHQIRALASAGYRVVAPDLRGYGGTDAPGAIEAYSILHLVGDVVGLVAALGYPRAHIVGQDWGAALAWNAALMRPDVFPTVAAMSVPFQPRREGKPPIPAYREIAQRKQLGEFYMVTYQTPGLVEAEYEADVDRTMRLMMYMMDGATPPADRFDPFITDGGTPLTHAAVPERLPRWLDETDLAVFVQAFQRNGFRGPLNWYRNLDRNWELTSAFQDATIRQPALYLTGVFDPVRKFAGAHERTLADAVPGLTELIEVAGAGHWVPQEAPDVVNAALLRFLAPRRALAAR